MFYREHLVGGKMQTKNSEYVPEHHFEFFVVGVTGTPAIALRV